MTTAVAVTIKTCKMSLDTTMAAMENINMPQTDYKIRQILDIFGILFYCLRLTHSGPMPRFYTP